MKKLPFSDTEYRKLEFAVFPTIRRRDKYGDVGDVLEVTHGNPYEGRETIGEAEIVGKDVYEWQNLPETFRMFDTESETVWESYQSINKFYKKDIQQDEELTIYWLRWTERYD